MHAQQGNVRSFWQRMKRTQLDFLLYKSSLLDDASERKRQALARTVQMHKLYVSSVSAVDTILHKVMPLCTSRARQDKYDQRPCIRG